MNLDLRIPMGLDVHVHRRHPDRLGYQDQRQRSLYAKSLGINANLWWGLVLLVFG